MTSAPDFRGVYIRPSACPAPHWIRVLTRILFCIGLFIVVMDNCLWCCESLWHALLFWWWWICRFSLSCTSATPYDTCSGSIRPFGHSSCQSTSNNSNTIENSPITWLIGFPKTEKGRTGVELTNKRGSCWGRWNRKPDVIFEVS